MQKKIIQISSTSSSFFLNSGKGNTEDIIKDDWFAQVAKEMKRLYPEKEIECWNPEKSYKKETVKEYFGIKFRSFPTTISIRPGMELSFEMINALNKELRKAKEENKKLILHFHEYHSWQIYLILFFVKRNQNLKIIAQHHGGRSPLKNLRKYKRLFLFFPLIALMQFCENLLFKKVDFFYALSDEEILYLKDKTRAKIKFQTMGIPNKYFKQENKRSAREKLNLDLKKKYLLYVGRLKITKGIRELLDAMKNLEQENVELLLIGRGPDFGIFKEYAEKSRLQNVNFLGAIYGNARIRYFDACDILILPSYTEGAPVVLMEAIAKNLPVIATNVGGIPKMIKNGREGIIIKPKSSEEIVKALKEILTWKRKNIRKSAEKYRWKKIIEETMKD